MQKRLVIAGTGSGVGKTTITIGLMQALKSRGMNVQGFKCGPDFIDPAYHMAVTGRPSYNLDSWLVDEETVKDTFIHASVDADISLIEGVMGFYDGQDPLNNVGSTAEISMLLEAPVLLVVNIRSIARSAAAIVKGFQQLEPNVHIAGVILNQAGSTGHAKLCQLAIEQECRIPVVGYLLHGDSREIPERSPELMLALKRGELTEFLTELGHVIREKVDLDEIIRIATTDRAVTISCRSIFTKRAIANIRLAIAYDDAFHFYYRENLALLEQAGATLVYFSPIHDSALPDNIDGLYIGGGFPEEFAQQLANNESMKASLRSQLEAGLPTLAEGGGYTFLANSLTTVAGKTYPMIGFIEADVTVGTKLAAIGYREMTSLAHTMILEEGEKARGHEFHYSTLTNDDRSRHVYKVKGIGGEKQEGFFNTNVVATLTHLHFASNLNIPKRFVKACEAYRW